MNIPARVVLKKMDEELAKLKHAVNETGRAADYRQYAQALKTYCDLLLESDESSRSDSGAAQAPNVAKATPEDMKRLMMGDLDDPPEKKPARTPQQKKKQNIYDGGDEPESDSLFDF